MVISPSFRSRGNRVRCHRMRIMTMARRRLIDPAVTPYYHCTSRCVRRAFLCGRDAVTGFDFGHRRAWIEKRLAKLSSVFAIDICAYAVMSNHYHVVLRIDVKSTRAMTDDETIDRWSKIYRIPDWFQRAGSDSILRQHTLALWRERLHSVSWFMRSVNEPLARWANREDGCKGRFWEGRFHSQALLDAKAVLRCMTYVDLNPVRAGFATTPESSNHTSVKARALGRDLHLASLESIYSGDGIHGAMDRRQYLLLVECSGRCWRPDKRGRITRGLSRLFRKLGESELDWVKSLATLQRHYYRAIGSTAALVHYREHLGQTRLWGLSVQI